jgi:hypothetical protein
MRYGSSDNSRILPNISRHLRIIIASGLTKAWRKIAMQVQTNRMANVDPVGKLPSLTGGAFFFFGSSSKLHWISLS